MNDLIAKARALVSSMFARRSQAYARVFDTDHDPLGDRKYVLDDLMRFCHFGEAPYHPEQRKTDVLIGRQEVLHRILDYAKLDAATLYEKYNRDKFNPRQPQE
jgi:hypothetical protein